MKDNQESRIARAREMEQRAKERRVRENLRIGMRIDLEVLSSFDLIVTTSTSDSDSVSMRVRLKSRCSIPNVAPHMTVVYDI